MRTNAVVIHRDLKPANIKINSDGVVKVLDFGLAKVLEDEPVAGMIENSPTLTLGHTRAGVILGTAAYMSPEQAVGRPVDRRSDIFSFGAVLYEMLTGKRAFAGTTTADVLEAIVKSDADWAKLPAEMPPALRTLLRRCLVKDRKQRLQAIGEARILLHGPMEEVATALASAPPVSRLGRLTAIAAALLAVGFAVAGAGWWRATRPIEQPLKPLVRLDVDLGPDVSLNSNGSAVIISPDGTRLVYSSRGKLFTRRFDQVATAELAGTEGAALALFLAGRAVGRVLH